MKKLYALLLATVLAVTLVLPAIAAPSPGDHGGGGGGGGGGSTPTSAPAPTVTAPAPVTAVTITVAGTAVTAPTDERVEAFAKMVADENIGFLAMFGIPATAKVAAVFELEFKGEIPAGGLIVPVKVNNAKAGDYAVVMHRKANGDWEVVGSAILGADLTVTATFTSFSPVMVLVTDAANVTAEGIKAPKAGE